MACRMLRACVLGPNGSPSGHSASAWFSGGGSDSPAVAVHVDGRVLGATPSLDRFRSELVLAMYLKDAVAGIAHGKGENDRIGITLQVLDGATSVADTFLESINREKNEAGKKIVLLHEHGTPILDISNPGSLVWDALHDDDATIVVGNHRGFPARVEEELLSTSDHIVSIGVTEPREAAAQVSYLGSHVIQFLQMFNPPD